MNFSIEELALFAIALEEDAVAAVNRKRRSAHPMRQKTGKNRYSRDSRSSTSSVENDTKIFCPKCKTEVPHSKEGIQQDQTKLLIAKVYHFLEQEYEDLQKQYDTLDLTRLSRVRQRTALATGVSEKTVSQILKEEKARNEFEEEESRKKRRTTRKRPRQTYSSSEDDVSDPSDHVDDSDDQSHSDEDNETAQQELETLVVKIEPPEFHEEPEIYIGPTVVVKQEPSNEMIEVPVETDPIAREIKTEPLDIADSTNSTNKAPEVTKRSGKKKARENDVTSAQQQSQGDTSTTEASSSVPLTEELDESSSLGATAVKVEEFEIHEEGFT